MKSVVAEASSIAKAIELAWQKAGQPKEFLVKVFQEPQRNMFGLTKTTAKVGIFFDDAALNQKIKNAAQSTSPVAANIKPSSPITPIKPINKPVAQKQNNKPNKPQIKSENQVLAPENAPAETIEQTANTNPAQNNSRNKNNNPNKPVQPKVNSAPRPANRPNNNRVNQNRNNSQAVINSQNSSQPVVNLEIPVQVNTMPQEVLPPVIEKQLEQRPARNKYYRRRKPRTPRAHHGEHTNEKPATPNNVVKNSNKPENQ